MIDLNLTIQECETIIAGLLELPAKFSLDLITKVRSQAIPQVEKQPTTTDE